MLGGSIVLEHPAALAAAASSPPSTAASMVAIAAIDAKARIPRRNREKPGIDPAPSYARACLCSRRRKLKSQTGAESGQLGPLLLPPHLNLPRYLRSPTTLSPDCACSSETDSTASPVTTNPSCIQLPGHSPTIRSGPHGKSIST